jgi:hypothetical protein
MNHEPDLKLEFTKLLLTFSYIQIFPFTPSLHNYPSTLVLPPFHRSLAFVSEPPASEMIERWVDARGVLDFRREDFCPPPLIPWTILLQ